MTEHRDVWPPAPLPMRHATWNRVAGILLTLALALALTGLRPFGFVLPNPVLFFADLIVLSALLGGVRAGMASVLVTLAFVLLYWSVPGHFLRYSPVDQKRLLVLALTMPPLGFFVGLLRQAYDRKQRELVERNARLTEELKRRAELENMQRDVEHILRHDLRIPLTSIISIPGLLLEDDNLSEEQREMLTMVSSAGRKMLGQINSSLDLRKIEEGSYAFVAQPCDPARILRDNFDVLVASGQTEKTMLRLVEDVPIRLETDERLLDIILSNLLRNALEASDKGCPVVVELDESNGECVISVINNRPVPEEMRPRFFEKYATAGKAGGTGLGTYSAYLMSRAIGADISMETSEQCGTTVTVRVPLKKNATPSGRPEAAARPARTGTKADVTVSPAGEAPSGDGSQ